MFLLLETQGYLRSLERQTQSFGKSLSHIIQVDRLRKVDGLTSLEVASCSVDKLTRWFLELAKKIKLTTVILLSLLYVIS